MVFGGTTTVFLIVTKIKLAFNLDANIFGIAISALVYFLVSRFNKQ